jgi:hypothetical protein
VEAGGADEHVANAPSLPAQVLPPQRPAEAVEGGGAQQHADHGRDPRLQRERGQAGQRVAQQQPAVGGAAPERRQPPDQGGVDLEGLPAGVPALPVHRRRHQLHQAVQEDEAEHVHRAVGVAVDQLQPGERQQPGRRRPEAEPGGHRPGVVGVGPPAEPGDPLGEQPQRAHGPHDGPEQQRQGHDPDPEPDEQPGRGGVGAAGVAAEGGHQDGTDQGRQADQAQGEPQRRGVHQPLQPHGQGPAAVGLLQPGGLPEPGQHEEGHDQHHGGRVLGQPDRDGQVGPAAEPMGEDPHSTWSSTSFSAASSSSTSNTPGVSAWNSSTAGVPGSMSTLRS